MNVLIAVDNSLESRHAVDAAFSFFGRDASYSVLSVADHQPLILGAWGAGSFTTAAHFHADLDAAAANAAAETAQTKADRLPVDAKVKTSSGHTGTAICDAASDASTDLIVIGSRDRGFWGRLLDPSVGHFLIDNAPCSVVIVR